MTGRAAAAETPSEVVDQDLLGAARLLRETLVRVHPSFRFEERLARRLASRSWGPRGRTALVVAREGDALDDVTVIPFPLPAPVGALEALPIEFDADLRPSSSAPPLGRDVIAWWGHVPRGALIGGAIASGFSIAGAALLARRWRQRPRVAQPGRGAA